MPQDYLQLPCTLLYGCCKNATKRMTTNEVRTTVTQLHLWQSCKSASPSCGSIECERTTIVQANRASIVQLPYFRKNPHEVWSFVCDLPYCQTIVRLMCCRLNSLPARGKFCHLLMNFANSLDPDQA